MAKRNTAWKAANGPCFILSFTERAYRIADVRAAIERHGVKLPVDYELFGRSFDGIDYRFAGPLRKHRPEDFERLRFWFPMVDLEILRHENKEKGE